MEQREPHAPAGDLCRTAPNRLLLSSGAIVGFDRPSPRRLDRRPEQGDRRAPRATVGAVVPCDYHRDWLYPKYKDQSWIAPLQQLVALRTDAPGIDAAAVGALRAIGA